MGIYEGLDQINKYKQDLADRKAAAEANKINWLKMEDNESVKIWVLQELDRGAENYHEECGIGLMATEHTAPHNWRKKALCTADEDGCLGCEEHRKDWKAGWKQKSRIYLNVLVERKSGEREVAVMSQANGPRSTVGPMLLELAVEENTIANRWYKMTKSPGENGVASYAFLPLKESKDVDPTEYAEKLYDLHRAVRHIPYEEQFDFYFEKDGSDGDAGSEAVSASGPKWPSDSGTDNEEW